MSQHPMPRLRLVAVGLLSLLALAGNAVSLPLFFGTNLLFGSIAALMALYWLGPLAGLAVAAIGSSATWLLGGHLYTTIIVVAEIAVIAWLGQRPVRGNHKVPMLATRDALYWVLVGIPLTLILYHFALGLEWASTWLVALKQAFNGILNAAIAGLIILAMGLFWKSQRSVISFRRLLFNVLLLAILLPALLLMTWQTNGLKHRLETELAQRARLTGAAAANQLASQAGVDMTDPIELEATLDALSHVFCEQIAADWGSQLSLSLEPRATWQTEADSALRATSVQGLWVWLPDQPQATEITLWRDGEYQVLLPQSLSPLDDQSLIVSVSAAPLIDDLQRQILRLLLALLSLALFGIAIAAWLSSRLTPVVHQRALQRLAHSEARLSAIFDHSPFGIALVGQDRRPLLVNQAFAQLLGTKAKVLKQMRFDELTHPDDLHQTLAAFEDLFAERCPAHRFTSRYLRTDGELVWGELRLSRLSTSPESEPVALAILENVTELHDARNRQRAAEQELADYAEQLGSLLDLANHALPYMAQICELLRLAQRTLGLETAAVWQLGADNSYRLLCSVPDHSNPPQAPPPIIAAQASAELGGPVIVSIPADDEADSSHEHSVIIGVLVDQLTEDGDQTQILITLQGTAGIASIETGQRQLLRLIAQRIAAVNLRHQLQETLVHARERETIGHLASGISHDFNNLLGVIDANLFYLGGSLEELAATDPEISQVLAETRSALGQAKVLTSGMLAISGFGRIPLKAIDLADTIGDLRQILDQVLPPRIHLQIEIEAGLQGFSNRAFLQSALLNLILNARDAMSDQGTLIIAARAVRGTTAIEPTVGVIPALDCAEIRVGDTGDGIAPEVLDRIFEPLFSTKAKQRGHGLGLFMVREFVNRTHAGLWVESSTGEGTCCRLWLPSQAPQQPPKQVPRTPAAISAPQAQAISEPKRLLLVEDDRRVRDSLSRLLKSEGIAVETANDGELALQRLATLGGAVDLVLSDIAMPGMDGLELCAQLAEHYPRLPIILMTGQHAHWEPPLNSRGQTVTILRKPIDLIALKEAMHQVLVQKPA